MAARWNGYRQEEFEELDGERQSMLVALYRTTMQLDSVIASEQAKDDARRSKSKPKGS